MTQATTKRLPKDFNEAEIKLYDSLSKTSLAEVLRDLAREKGVTDWIADAKARDARLNPAGAGGSGSQTDRILSAAQYLALTAISAHAGGMPATLYQAGVQKEHRESFESRGFVKVNEVGAAVIQDAGNKALDRYEQRQTKKTADAQAGGSAAGTSTGTAAAPAPTQTPTPVATPEGVGDFG